MLFMLLFRTQDEARRWHPCNIIYLSKLRAPTLYRTTSSMTIYNSQTKIDSHRTELQTSILLPYLKGQEEHTHTHIRKFRTLLKEPEKEKQLLEQKRMQAKNHQHFLTGSNTKLPAFSATMQPISSIFLCCHWCFL